MTRQYAAALVAAVLGVALWWPAASAADAPGQVYAFGDNQYGELASATGNGTPAPNPAPALVGLPAGAGPIRAAAAGTFHSLTLAANGQLFAFGLNRYGQLGTTTNTTTDNANPAPSAVSLPGAAGPVVAVAAGGNDSLAITSTGQLYAFGSNTFGQLGSTTHTGTAMPNPTPTLVGLPGATGQVTAVSAGADHSLAVTSTGQLYAFGLNNYGQLGNSTNAGTPTANPVPALVLLPGAAGRVMAVAAGSFFSLALTSSGQLYAFGSNQNGQLGTPNNAATTTANPTPSLVALPGATGAIVAIAAGASHSLVLTSTSQLYAFGYNRYGQLGSTTNTNTSSPNPTPTPAGLPSDAGGLAGIGAGSDQSFAVTSTGRVYAFGFNMYGQLGVTTSSGTSNPVSTPTLIGVPASTSVDSVASGSTAGHTLVVVADLAVSTTTLPAGRVGVSYSTRLAASGGVGPYHWRSPNLPSGLSIDAGSGSVTGTPTISGNYPVAVSVSDADGIAASAQLVLAVGKAPPSAARIRALLLRELTPHGRAASIRALLRHRGYTEPAQTLSAGTIVIGWYFVPRGARPPKARPRPVLVALGRATLKAAWSGRFTIKLTSAGLRMLGHAARMVLVGRGVFTPVGAGPVSVIVRFSLKR